MRFGGSGTALIVVLALLTLTVPATADHAPPREKTAQELAIYHTWPTLTQELMALEEANPEIMTVESLGTSVLGMDIWGVHLAANEDELALEHRERIYIDGGTHANEQLGMELAFHFVEWLVTGYGENETATWVLDNRDVYIVPMVNPDGNSKDSRQNARLVDINRNFPFDWAEAGSSDTIGSGTYHGPEPASEPETRIIMGILDRFDPDYTQSYHTGITMFLHPWGGNGTDTPDDAVYDTVCAELAKTIDPEAYPCGNVHDTIYPATGATVGYAYGELGAISFTFEVDDSQGVYWSLEEIPSRLAESFQGTLHALLHAEKYGNHPVLLDASIDGDELTVTIQNQGYGDSASTAVHVHGPDGELLVEEPLGRLNQTQPVTRTLELGEVPDEVALKLVYEKTNYNPNTKIKGVVLDLAALAEEGLAPTTIVDDLGLEIASVDEELSPLSADDGEQEGVPAPGLAPVIALIALAGLALRRRS